MQSPCGSVSSCIVSTFGISIMLRTGSPTKGQFILKANPCLKGSTFQQAVVVPTQPLGREETTAKPNSTDHALSWARGQGRNNSPSSTDNPNFSAPELVIFIIPAQAMIADQFLNNNYYSD